MSPLEIILSIINIILLVYIFKPKSRKKYELADYTLYLLINTDLGMSKGKIISQIAHAIGSVYENTDPDLIKAWLSSGSKKVVLKSNQDFMNELVYKCKRSGIIAYPVIDAGRTQIPSGSLTVLAIGPELTEKSKEYVKSLKLY
ncbi:putative peptidyl-tRNA hydrolase 2 [Dictyocoela muelleri]|nr:putative peptidyl-tRNA hydrolase 2 [Dictyocoela muelleri]